MNNLSHKQARILIQADYDNHLGAEEREALAEHLHSCESCRTYATVHAHLQATAATAVSIPEPSPQEYQQLLAGVRNHARSKPMLRQLTTLTGPIAWAAIVISLLFLFGGFFNQRDIEPDVFSAAPPEAMPAATTTPSPMPTPTPVMDQVDVADDDNEPRPGTPTPVMDIPSSTTELTEIVPQPEEEAAAVLITIESEALAAGAANFVEVDLSREEARPHRQVAARFSLTVQGAQAEVDYLLKIPTVLPHDFNYIGADVADAGSERLLDRGVSMVFVQDVPPEGYSPILMFSQQPALPGVANFDPHESDDPLVTINPVISGTFSGEYRLNARAGRATLRWQADGIRYTLTMDGDLGLGKVENLVYIANSLQ